MEMHEITIGNKINVKNCRVFTDFVETFGEYIAFVSGPQTALLNDKFTAHKGIALYEMQAWFERKGINGDAWDISASEEKQELELLGECLTKKEATDVAKELIERGCDMKFVLTYEGYSVYASGNLPEWAKVDDCESADIK